MESLKIASPSLDNATQEAYRSLRTNIQFCGADIKVIAVTSCEQSEGKTTISFKLAESLAEAGKQVVYIDADLRKSMFVGKYRVRGISNGLSHYLSAQCNLDEAVYSTDIKNLCVIVAGPTPPNPAELLGGKRFAGAVQSLRNAFDYVIIDTPPLGSVIDCAVISTSCDGIVMVIASGEISLKAAHSVKRQIEKTGCPLLGVVLNKMHVSGRGYYGYYGKGDRAQK